MRSVNSVVLDASALLALLKEEPGSEVVAESIPGAAISAVNLAEVVGKLVDAGMPESSARDATLGLGLEIHPFDAEAAFVTGGLRGKTREAGLSLGDRACLALAIQRSLPAITTDRSWKSLKVGVTVRIVR
jgi:ribonuclease VapC